MAQEPLKPSDYTERLGEQFIRIEEDLICTRFVGTYTPDEANRLLSLCDELHRKYGRVYMLSDMSAMKPPPPETRKILAKWPLVGNYALVAYGVGRPMRVIIQLVLAGRRLLGMGDFDVHVAADELSGRQWIAEHRRKLPAPK